MAQAISPFNMLLDYWRDACERSVIYLDILRQRGKIYLAQGERTAPHVLNFPYKILVDGRMLQRPVNYVLVRIVPSPDVSIDENKRPFIIFDPRAGHGPGIGGMKHDSEIGVALRAGHACYFVGFLPNPVPGQTIEDVCRAEAFFVETVIERHRNADGRPVLIGNCQAGWQIMMMAALAPDLPGPILIAGAPLSYWAGVHGKNPMRYLGGMLGGTWLTELMSDLGNGVFDGAWLISNFEANNPSNTFWTKQYNVYAKADSEGPRYLEFEKWWGNPVLLNGEEIQFIVDELFVGNRLAPAEIVMNGQAVDLRKIKSPIIVFCSFGDDITPPQQALDWILDLYKDVEDIIANGQTIVYSLHPSVGHLGIFVSAKVAKKEHEEFVFNIDLIDMMPPGLYEIVLDEVTPAARHPELISGKYVARLAPRTLDDIRALGGNDAADERCFQTVARVSEINKKLYEQCMRPAVEALSTPMTAEFLRQMHPNRIAFRAFSDRNPAMRSIAGAAENVKANRHPVEAENPFLKFEKIVSSWIVANLDIYAAWRDAATENLFFSTYGSPLLQAAVGRTPLRADGMAAQIEAPKLIDSEMSRGGPIEAGLRALLYVQAGEGADERQFNAIEALRENPPEGVQVSLPELKQMLRAQADLLRADAEGALSAVAKMLPDDAERRARLLSNVYDVATADGPLTQAQIRRFERTREAFGFTKGEDLSDISASRVA